MTTTDYKFEGWLGRDPSSADGNMEWGSFEPKAWEENDVDIKITHAGVCLTDIATLREGWGQGDTALYPICVGHEIVGKVVRVGSEVKHLQVGDRVGAGAQTDACLERFGDCQDCAEGEEQYCPKLIPAYNARHYNGDKTMGGYANYHRCNSHFAIKIPDGLKSEDAAPMTCGGITMYSPLKRFGCGPGKTVGIIGVGGLGHFGVIFAKALGADHVVGISRREAKRTECLEMGADDYIATADDPDWAKNNAGKFDLLICTVSSPDMPVPEYLSLLKKDGTYCQVGNFNKEGALSVHPLSLIVRRVHMTGSQIGTTQEIREMFQLAAEKQCKFWIETKPMSAANEAIVGQEAGKARYRYVLVNEETA